MNRRIPLLAAALALIAACQSTSPRATPATQPWTRPASTESTEVLPPRKLTDYRLRAPILVTGDTMKFIIEAPPSALADDGQITAHAAIQVTPEGQHPATPPQPFSSRIPAVRAAVTFHRYPLRDEDDAATQPAASRPATAPASGPARSPATARRREKPLVRGEIELPCVFPDGYIEAALIGHPDSTVRIEVRRNLLDRVDPRFRDELATWLKDANEADPIWGKVPAWRNLRALIERLKTGPTLADDPFAAMRGFILRSYVNPQLARRQPYTVYVPHSLDLAKPQPLLILLHGSGGDYRNIIADEFAGQRFEQSPMLIANAGAFRSQEFRHLALNDVRWIIEDLASKYRIDRSRIYLQGISLGGRGTLELAALLPDTFAAVSAQGSYGTSQAGVDPLQAQVADPVAAALMARSDLRTWLPNLRNTPAELAFGWRDDTTLPLNPLLFEACLRQVGATVVARGFDATHDISLPAYDFATTRAWFLQHTKPAAPATILHRVSNLRFGKNAWVEVHALEDYARVGEVIAHFDEAKKLLILQTDNIAALTIDPPGVAVAISINGSRPAPLRWTGPMTFRGGFGPAGKVSPVPLNPATELAGQKRAGCSGPLWDVFSSPFIYVYDTSLGPVITERLRKSAQRSARWDMSTGEDSFPVIPDTELTDVLRRSRNVLWFTTSASKNIPVATPFPDGLARQGLSEGTLGREPNVRVALRPSPWKTDGYVLVAQLDCPRPFSLHELGWWDAGLQSDWIAGRAEADRPVRRRGGLRFVAAGVYDAQWKPGAWTTQDFRAEALLGPGAGGH